MDPVEALKDKLVEAVRAWANADCGATEADGVLAALVSYEDAVHAGEVSPAVLDATCRTIVDTIGLSPHTGKKLVEALDARYRVPAVMRAFPPKIGEILRWGDTPRVVGRCAEYKQCPSCAGIGWHLELITEVPKLTRRAIRHCLGSDCVNKALCECLCSKCDPPLEVAPKASLPARITGETTLGELQAALDAAEIYFASVRSYGGAGWRVTLGVTTGEACVGNGATLADATEDALRQVPRRVPIEKVTSPESSGTIRARFEAPSPELPAASPAGIGAGGVCNYRLGENRLCALSFWHRGPHQVKAAP